MAYVLVFIYAIPSGITNTACLYANVQRADDNSHQLQSSGSVVTPNAFQHVALTYDKSSGVARLYRNGAVVAETTFGSFTPKTTGNLNIGNRPIGPANESFTLSGVIDELPFMVARCPPTKSQRSITRAVSENAAVLQTPARPRLSPISRPIKP